MDARFTRRRLTIRIVCSTTTSKAAIHHAFESSRSAKALGPEDSGATFANIATVLTSRHSAHLSSEQRPRSIQKRIVMRRPYLRDLRNSPKRARMAMPVCQGDHDETMPQSSSHVLNRQMITRIEARRVIRSSTNAKRRLLAMHTKASWPLVSGNASHSKASHPSYLPGPLRAPTNIRSTIRWDYQPDLCKVSGGVDCPFGFIIFIKNGCMAVSTFIINIPHV